MRFEVEQKHAVADSESLIVRLAALGVELTPPEVEVDRYLAHPARDFAHTDEALRIRTVGGASFVTYKGPKLDAAAKIRREIELPLDRDDCDGERFAELLAALGFSPVATVRKQRRKFHVDHAGATVVGTLDQVEQVGTFVELELLADEADIDQAKQTIASLAEKLELGPSDRRSYLEMLLGRSAGPG